MIREFIYKYYIDPVRYDQPYNIVETLTFALILIIALFLLARWLDRAGVKVDRRFVLATIPFVVFGGVLRVVEDSGVITSDLRFLVVTPLIYFVIFGICALTLVVSRELEVRGHIRDYVPWYAGTGAVCAAAAFLVLVVIGVGRGVFSLPVAGVILVLAALSTIAVLGMMQILLKWGYAADPLYRILVFGHMLDASATSYGIDIHPLHYMEQHVVGGTLIAATGTAFSMFPLKLLVLFPAVYILERFRNEGSSQLWHLIVLAMIVVGLAPGIRDMMRMVLYV